MKVLGIDPGYERLGVALVEKTNKKECLIYSTCITTDPSLPFYERLFTLGEEVGKIISHHQPEHLAIETLLFNTNQKTAMRVAEARGVVIYEALRTKMEVFDYTPLQIKTALTGYGRSEKHQVVFMVEKVLGVTLKDKFDDECDAIAVALTHTASI